MYHVVLQTRDSDESFCVLFRLSFLVLLALCPLGHSHTYSSLTAEWKCLHMSTNYLTSRVLRRKLPLIDRFFIRENRAQETSKPINPEPFSPYKSPTTGRWLPPRLSLRRQAQLGKDAYKAGRFDELTQFVQNNGKVESVKLANMKARIRDLALEAERREGVKEAAAIDKLDDLVVGVKRTAREEQYKAVKLARALAATRGPYTGRSLQRIFKGTKAERFAVPRKLATKEKMSTMEKTVETWRKVSLFQLMAEARAVF
jgi:large subunit ribosomal protein L25